MSIWMETDKAFYLGGQACIVEDRFEEIAWAEKHVVRNPALAWVLGKFVESDKANSNKQYFSLDGLRMAQPSILHAPMNMNHSARRVVGTYVAAEMVYPTDTAASEPLNPYIESLGAFWKHYFPEEFHLVESAAKDGQLYFSMEALPRQLKCFGDKGCDRTFDYAGPSSPTYCAHLNERSSDKYFIDPHFTAGAILVPPIRPGWKHASVEQLSKLVADNAKEAEMAYDGIKESAPELSSVEWESMMGQLLEFSRNMSTKERKNLAKKGCYKGSYQENG